jgi:hypothetical protein
MTGPEEEVPKMLRGRLYCAGCGRGADAIA